MDCSGYRVEIASSGDAAVEMLKQASIAAILLEYRPDGIDSEAIACDIKERFPKLPIIMLSASEIPERILWLVDEYVMKSELPEGLARIIKRATHSTRAEGAYRFAA